MWSNQTDEKVKETKQNEDFLQKFVEYRTSGTKKTVFDQNQTNSSYFWAKSDQESWFFNKKY